MWRIATRAEKDSLPVPERFAACKSGAVIRKLSRLTGLLVRHATPSDRRWHDRLFGRNLLFNGDRYALMLDAGLLNHPIRITGGDQGQTPGIARPGPRRSRTFPYRAPGTREPPLTAARCQRHHGR